METESRIQKLISRIQNPESRISSWVFLLIILGLVFLVYFPALKGAFVWDDFYSVVSHEPIRSLKNIKQFFLDPKVSIANLYRPIRTLSFSLDYALWGLNPLGFHLTSLLLHLVNISLAYFLLKRFFPDNFLPFLGALFFGLHPVHTESVAWVSTRAEPLFAAFYLAAFLAYLKSRDYRGQRQEHLWWLLSLGLFALSLLSKEMAITLPLVLLAYEFLCRGGFKTRLYRLGGYFLVAGLYLLVRFALLGALPHRGLKNWQFLVGMDLKIIEAYARLLFYPQNLCLFHEVKAAARLWSWENFLPAGLLIILFFLAIWAYKRNRVLCWALVFMALTLLPVLHWVEIPGIFAVTERWLYLPVLGFAMLLAYGFKFLLDKAQVSAALNFIALSILAFLLVFYASRVGERLQDWQSDYALFSQTTRCAPRSNLGFMNLGLACIRRGEVDKAMALFSRATQIEPQNPETYTNLAMAHEMKGNFARAGQLFAAAGHLAARLPQPPAELSPVVLYYQAARCFYQAGKTDWAQKWWQETLKAGYQGPAPWE